MPCEDMKTTGLYFMDVNTGMKISDYIESLNFNTATVYKVPKICAVPEIVDVKVINNKVIIMTFIDGTQTKAVCDKDDTFNLEVGIGICITKRLMSDDEQTGNSMFNKSIKKALRVMKQNEQIEQTRKEIAEEEKRIIEKIKRKKEKRAEKRRQKKIQMMADAILLAEKMRTENNN